MAIEKRQTKGGETRYRVKVRDAGGACYPKRVFKRLVDAERHERELLAKRDAGAAVPSKEVNALTVQAFAKQWADERRVNVSKGWRYSQDQMLTAYIMPVIGSKKLVDIKPEHIGLVLQKMHDQGRGPQTRLHVFALLQRIFGDAVQYYHLISVNPVTLRDKPRVIKVEQPYLRPTEARTLLEYCKASYIGPAVWLATLAALRPSEVQALTVGAIDFERNMISIRAAYKRKVNEIDPYPKGKRKGEIPMPPALRQMMAEACAGKQPTDFVVAGLQGDMLSYPTFLRHLRQALRACGLPEVSPHKLRHSATELWIENGASEEDIVRLLNHSGSGAVRGYIHRSSERLESVAARIAVTEKPAAPTERPRLSLVR